MLKTLEKELQLLNIRLSFDDLFIFNLKESLNNFVNY